jgi:hypothetical protein
VVIVCSRKVRVGYREGGWQGERQGCDGDGVEERGILFSFPFFFFSSSLLLIRSGIPSIFHVYSFMTSDGVSVGKIR